MILTIQEAKALEIGDEIVYSYQDYNSDDRFKDVAKVVSKSEEELSFDNGYTFTIGGELLLLHVDKYSAIEDDGECRISLHKKE